MTLTEADQNPDDLLARAPLFARLSRRSLNKLGELCVPREFDADALIISEGTTGLGLFVITGGRVEVFMGEDESRVILATLEAGDLLGEMALVDDQPRSASAVALEATRCLLITRGSFQQLVKKDPEIAWCIVPTLAERIRELQQRMIDSDVVWEPTSDGPQPRDAAEATDDVSSKPSAVEDILRSLLRGQYALSIAGVAAVRGLARTMESMLRTLASETGVSGENGDPVADLPKGLLKATEAGLAEAERLPEQLVERYRRYRRGPESS